MNWCPYLPHLLSSLVEIWYKRCALKAAVDLCVWSAVKAVILL